MKKVMFALCFMFGGMVTLVAQDAQDTTSSQYRTETQSQYPQEGTQQQSQDDRERIQSTELPDEVKRTLEGAEYRGWLISGAFKSKGSDRQSSGQSDGNADITTPDDQNSSAQGTANATGTEEEEMYIVELKNGAETKTLRFDKEGEKLEDMAEQSGNSQFQRGNEDQSSEGQRTQNPNNQYNQGEQKQEVDPNEEAAQTDPGATSDQTEQSSDFNQSTETRTESHDDTGAADTGSNEPTETQSSQSTGTDQSKANEPK